MLNFLFTVPQILSRCKSRIHLGRFPSSKKTISIYKMIIDFDMIKINKFDSFTVTPINIILRGHIFYRDSIIDLIKYLHLLTSRRYDGKLDRLGFGSGISSDFMCTLLCSFLSCENARARFLSSADFSLFLFIMECDDTDFY